MRRSGRILERSIDINLKDLVSLLPGVESEEKRLFNLSLLNLAGVPVVEPGERGLRRLTLLHASDLVFACRVAREISYVKYLIRQL